MLAEANSPHVQVTLPWTPAPARHARLQSFKGLSYGKWIEPKMIASGPFLLSNVRNREELAQDLEMLLQIVVLDF